MFYNAQEAIFQRKKWEASKLPPAHSQRNGERLSILRYNAGYGSADELAEAMQRIEGGTYPSVKTVQAIECNQKPVTEHYLLLFRIATGDIDIVSSCPTCRRIHLVGDCQGKNGQPIIVSENEEVRKRIYKMSKPEPARHRLTTSIEDYQWMRENGYKSVGDLVAALKKTISRDMSILQSQLETQ